MNRGTACLVPTHVSTTTDAPVRTVRGFPGPADWVTLARATLAIGVAVLVADSFARPARVAMLVTLAAVALALDLVDGWVARRTGTASKLGARLDGEVDAFLILVLSVYVARSTGAWVLAIGAARYVFLAAGWLLPWLCEPLPPRYWRKVVCAMQGIVLTIAAADLLPPLLTRAALVIALALLAESFGRDVWWLWARRHASGRSGGLAVAGGAGRGRARTIAASAAVAQVCACACVALSSDVALTTVASTLASRASSPALGARRAAAVSIWMAAAFWLVT